MQLPFTTEQFLAVFGAYNLAVWPAQIILYVLGAALVLLAYWRSGRPWVRWAVAAGLAVLWAWMGAVYHFGFFADINPAARAFGATFIAQAALWFVWAVRTPGLRFRPRERSRRLVGASLIGYAFVAYPLLNVLLGHAYPRMPTFGAPCPTTIATFGLLCWAAPRPPWFVWVIPVLWALVGTSAAFVLGIREDLGLLAAVVLAIAVQTGSRRAAMRA